MAKNNRSLTRIVNNMGRKWFLDLDLEYCNSLAERKMDWKTASSLA